MRVIAALVMAAGATLIMAMQTDFGVRVPPSARDGAPDDPNVTVVRPKHVGVFSCAVRSVTDGDTFRCTNGTGPPSRAAS